MSDHGIARSSSNAQTRHSEVTIEIEKNIEAKRFENDQERGQNASTSSNGNISHKQAYWKGESNQDQVDGTYGPGMGFNPFFPPLEGAGPHFPLFNGHYPECPDHLFDSFLAERTHLLMYDKSVPEHQSQHPH